MKRQGKYGFTWDSKAEEWAAWAWGCLTHNPPRNQKEKDALDMMILAYGAETWKPAPANPDPYRAIIWRDEPRKAPLWPFAAIAVVAAVAAVIIWTWG